VTENQQKEILQNWLNKYKGLIFKIVRAYAFTTMNKDDLFQEIIIQVWRSIPMFRQKSSITTWLYRISLNTAIRWTQKENKHNHEETTENLQYIIHDNKVPTDERLDWLYEEIRQLNEIDRSLTLLLLDGFSYKEMATILGITESNVGVKINRIKKQLIVKSKKYDYHGI